MPAAINGSTAHAARTPIHKSAHSSGHFFQQHRQLPRRAPIEPVDDSQNKGFDPQDNAPKPDVAPANGGSPVPTDDGPSPDPVQKVWPRTFDCRYPVRSTDVSILNEPLPFPTELPVVVAWIEAFASKARELVLQEQREKESLAAQLAASQKATEAASENASYWYKMYNDLLELRPDERIKKLTAELEKARRDLQEANDEKDDLVITNDKLRLKDAELEAENTGLKQVSAQLRDDVAQLKKQLSDSETKYNDLSKDMETLQSLFDEAQKGYTELFERYKALQAEDEQVQAGVKKLQADIIELTESLNKYKTKIAAARKDLEDDS